MGERVVGRTIVDSRLSYLVSIGKLEDTKDKMWLRLTQEYWDEFIKMCDDDIVDFVLSYPQSGNWNGWLYAACEKRRGLKPNR